MRKINSILISNFGSQGPKNWVYYYFFWVQHPEIDKKKENFNKICIEKQKFSKKTILMLFSNFPLLTRPAIIGGSFSVIISLMLMYTQHLIKNATKL